MLHNAQVYISEQYNTHFLLTSLTYATTLSVKTFPGRLSATPWGAAPSNLLHTTLALSTTLTNFNCHQIINSLPSNQSCASSYTYDQYANSLVPRRGGERERAPGYTLFAHTHNYSDGHMAELGACTNMTTNGSCEQHKPS